MLTAERLRGALHYDPATGQFTWLSAGSRRAGKVAGGDGGGLHYEGYWVIHVDGRSYRAHRLAWLYTHGEWPAEQIDPINGDRADNRIVNLREATNRENQQNRAKRADNTSGYMGVSWQKIPGKWQAQIMKAGRKYHLGRYDTAEEAHAAYLAAKAQMHPFQSTPRDTISG